MTPDAVLRRCRWCGAEIIRGRDGVWRLYGAADVNGYCRQAADGDLHEPSARADEE